LSPLKTELERFESEDRLDDASDESHVTDFLGARVFG